jgi:hypothetical protein
VLSEVERAEQDPSMSGHKFDDTGVGEREQQTGRGRRRSRLANSRPGCREQGMLDQYASSYLIMNAWSSCLNSKLEVVERLHESIK